VIRFSRQFCVFEPSRWAPAARCQCPHCVARREYKRVKQQIYQARLSPEQRAAQKLRWAQRYRNNPEWRARQILKANAWRAEWPLAHLLYSQMRNLMMRDGCWR
jgi:hypothetical protein